MRIYTKTGDDGSTGLFGGARVDKDSARVEAYGTVDELNAAIGVIRAERSGQPSALPDEIDAMLATFQNTLFALGAELACVPGKEDKLRMRLLDDREISALEAAIDGAEAELPPLTSFILPTGSRVAALLHQARTICRRAERRVLSAGRVAPVRGEVLVYLNRLGDLLFVLARRANQLAGRPDVPWLAAQS
ncbi:MAG TPA: cob(I)yrinic acid a,c-diamide adenosyltransferase [Polyangiaceae bacterium]|nr:cob(I)yrinic acid a,c-diamide adenosyltransferase [Polyangiaceae bacterium]